ncbi:tartronate semialdehyde reductase [Marinithermofilum abyssi]|uniref:Tartronate semialdehyde reductase n=1 Tax=Marinithermofilum abyssi TaxID=1571185 RepID=A0A8J2YEI0_9BACL|nr:tartronate semialdehyde reductase [Marinithermofilum abyssi]
MEQSKRVGFVGLGIMGRSMAKNVAKRGFPVTVWNRTPAKMAEAREWGARLAAHPKEAAEQCDVVITIVGDTSDVREVALGPNGLLEGAHEGLIWIDMSTISPDATRELARVAAERGVRMLDAPVSGGDVGAREGTLSIMVGGDEETLAEVKPVLEAMGKNIVHCGSAGAGQTVKACNQIMCGVNLLGMVEALAFARKSGVDLDKMIQVTTQGAAGSWALANLAPRVVRGDLDPGFSVRFQQKDLRIVLEEAARLMLPLLGTSTVHQLLRSVEAHDGGEDGTHALIRVMEQLGNLKIVPSKE